MGTKKKIKNQELKIRLEDSLKDKYKLYCSENNLDMSKHMREFIEKTVNKK